VLCDVKCSASMFSIMKKVRRLVRAGSILFPDQTALSNTQKFFFNANTSHCLMLSSWILVKFVHSDNCSKRLPCLKSIQLHFVPKPIRIANATTQQLTQTNPDHCECRKQPRQTSHYHAFILRKVHNLSRIHQPVWIKCSFDTSHYPDGVLSELFDKAMFLPKSNSMFACAGTIC
jgi:hypothetical protein